jgi:hypothetical protein
MSCQSCGSNSVGCASTNINNNNWSNPSATPVSGYNTLGNYYSVSGGSVNGPPVPATVPSMTVQVVPSFGGVGYANEFPYSGTGYYSLGNAYPAFPNNCMAFTNRACGN